MSERHHVLHRLPGDVALDVVNDELGEPQPALRAANPGAQSLSLNPLARIGSSQRFSSAAWLAVHSSGVEII
jgi:hypothetical protein